MKIILIKLYFQSKKGVIKANEWINEISNIISAKGGGKDTQAQATGTNTSNLNEAISLANKFAELKLN